MRQAAAIVLPRTSEADYKGFLYLREFVRQGIVQLPERILLMDLLQSTGGHVAAHNAAAARALFAALVVPDTGPSRSGRWYEDLHRAIVSVNTARAALRRLLALRRGWPRITGSEALADRRVLGPAARDLHGHGDGSGRRHRRASAARAPACPAPRLARRWAAHARRHRSARSGRGCRDSPLGKCRPRLPMWIRGRSRCAAIVDKYPA